MDRIRQGLTHKLQALIDKLLWTMMTHTDNVANLSTADITIDQMRVLGLGLGFNQKPTALSLVSAMANLRLTTAGDPHEGELLRGAVWSGILQLLDSDPTMPRRYRLALCALRKHPNLVCLPSDKGSKVVLLDRDQYISLAEEILADTRVYKERTKGNPLDYRITKLNRRLEEIQKGLPASQNGAKSKLLEPFIIHKRSIQNLPYAYFTPKVHKTYPPQIPSHYFSMLSLFYATLQIRS